MSDDLTVLVRNISALGQLDVPVIARQGEPFDVLGSGCLEPLEEFAVSASVAGHPPVEQVGQPGDADYVPADPGSGLLAQTDNFELVAASVPLIPPADTSNTDTSSSTDASSGADDDEADPVVVDTSGLTALAKKISTDAETAKAITEARK